MSEAMSKVSAQLSISGRPSTSGVSAGAQGSGLDGRCSYSGAHDAPICRLVHRGLDVDSVVPEASHLRAALDELVQLTSTDDLPAVEDDDLVGVLEGCSSM